MANPVAPLTYKTRICNPRNTSHPVPVPPITPTVNILTISASPPRGLYYALLVCSRQPHQYCLRLLEWQPQCPTAPRRSTPHYLHNPLGPITVQVGATRLCCTRQRINQMLQWDRFRHPEESVLIILASGIRTWNRRSSILSIGSIYILRISLNSDKFILRADTV